MMKVTLPQKWIDHLTQLPESGMGYQRVDVYFEDGHTQYDRLVLNAETIDLPDACMAKAIRDIKIHSKGDSKTN